MCCHSLTYYEYDTDSFAILAFLMLYETDFADFLLYIPYVLLEYGSDYIAGLAVYTLSDASTWTRHYPIAAQELKLIPGRSFYDSVQNRKI